MFIKSSTGKLVNRVKKTGISTHLSESGIFFMYFVRVVQSGFVRLFAQTTVIIHTPESVEQRVRDSFLRHVIVAINQINKPSRWKRMFVFKSITNIAFTLVTDQHDAFDFRRNFIGPCERYTDVFMMSIRYRKPLSERSLRRDQDTLGPFQPKPSASICTGPYVVERRTVSIYTFRP